MAKVGLLSSAFPSSNIFWGITSNMVIKNGRGRMKDWQIPQRRVNDV